MGPLNVSFVKSAGLLRRIHLDEMYYMQLSAIYFTGDNFSRNQHESWFEHSEGRGPNAGSRLHSLTDGSITEWCRPSLLVLGGAHAQLA